MLTQKDQLELFKLISQNLKTDLSCYAFGGTAMMFYGYKDETKDVDILFETITERTEFIRILNNLGYSETSAVKIYVPEKLKDPHAPIMLKRDESRFDIFVKKIFQTNLSPKMKEDLFAIHEYKGKHTFTVKVLRTEQLVILKSVTDRDKDFEDIINIIKKDQDFDWNYLIDEVLWQTAHGDGWVLLDMEETMQQLKKYIFIKEKWFKKLYQAKT